MSRSEFLAHAAERYLDELDAQSLTGQIDDALQRMGSDASGADAAALGRSILSNVDDE